MKNSDSSLMNCGLPSTTRANLNCNRQRESSLNIKHTLSNKPTGPNGRNWMYRRLMKPGENWIYL